MPATAPLHPAPPRFPLEIHPLARLHMDGSLELLGPAFPPLGPIALILWRPGHDPAFTHATGELRTGWRWNGTPHEAWVILWIPLGDPTPGF